MTKLYHGPEGQGWQIPGQQERKATRIDVPSSPAELAAWLNERHVWAVAREIDREQLGFTGEYPDLTMDELEQLGEPPIAGVVISAAEVERVNASRPAFLPRMSAEEIEARRMAESKCPKCGTGLALYANELEQIGRYMETADLEEIQRIVERARSIVSGRGEALEGRGVQ